MNKHLSKYKELLTSPISFFKKVKDESYKSTLIYIGIILLIAEIVEFLLVGIPLYSNTTFIQFLLILASIILSPFVTVGLFSGLAFFVHQGVLYFNKEQKYDTTWKIIVYCTIIPVVYNILAVILQRIGEYVNPWPEQSLLSTAPVMGYYSVTVLIILGIISSISLVHIIVTAINAMKEYYSLSTWQALGALIIPSIFYIVVVMSVIIMAGTYLSPLFS